MKYKHLYICFLFLSYCIAAQSQAPTITFIPGEDYSDFFKPDPKIMLDKAQMRVLYKLEILHDTINQNAKKTNNVMMLQIGSTNNKYCDYNGYKGDSILENADLSKRNTNDIMNEYIAVVFKSLSERIYWNYPNGKITVTDRIAGSPHVYEEDIPKIKWELETGTKTILDYQCLKATCYLFGRHYTAWYTLQIPIGKGPWKFSGLPGLILEIEDDQNQISWTCIALENKNDDIYFIEKDYIKIAKSDFLKSFADAKKNPGAILKSSGMITGDLPENAKRKRHYNPIEIEK